jgi:hypothetical protein
MAGRLIQIVPIRARTSEGVGDYARIIAERMRADAGLETSFISCTPLPPERRRQDEWESIELPERSSRALTEALDALEARHGAAPIILHLSGYGFDRRGAPFWLARALGAWRRRHPSARLAIVFHELFAIGPVWTRLFWMGQVQRRVTRALQALSNGGITTVGRTLEWLSHGPAHAPPFLFPCFATIGEPEGEVALASARGNTLAIFGRASVLDEIYGQWAGPLAEFVRANKIAEVIDIGARPVPPPDRIGEAKVTQLGELGPEALHAHLARARYGMLRYDADWLPKSSILAAYCAHGVIPVCLSGQRGDGDGLLPGTNYLKIERDAAAPCPDISAIDQLQARAQAWYRPHSIGPTTALLRGLIG